MQQELIDLVLETANQLREDEEWEMEQLTADTTLYGRDGVMDSMALVSLIIAVEQAIEDKFDQSVALADEKAMSQSRSPYRSPRRLAEYAESQL